ncbi:uncharacterized protein LOC121523405 [Cheilinus undulatus]|uniref:uncharacterized protein LOC121523405 n=1 Tax=Cheilinus undulatus TaxID=241271 RepID=UPI001BD5C6E7|nr:uncharacterized protein LOC121523405 [Cheilinus undulatus]
MDLRFSSLLLAVGLFLRSSALAADECESLLKPLTLDDPSVLHGKMHFIMGYTDGDLFKAILKTTTSSWVEISQAPSDSSVLLMSQGNLMNGTCSGSDVTVTIQSGTARAQMGDTISHFQSLQTCDGCLVFNINTTVRNLNRYLTQVNLGGIKEEESDNTRSLYLMANETTVQDSVLEHFKKQASCLGFTGEPDFHHKPENRFCEKDEVQKVEA